MAAAGTGGRADAEQNGDLEISALRVVEFER